MKRKEILAGLMVLGLAVSSVLAAEKPAVRTLEGGTYSAKVTAIAEAGQGFRFTARGAQQPSQGQLIGRHGWMIRAQILLIVLQGSAQQLFTSRDLPSCMSILASPSRPGDSAGWSGRSGPRPSEPPPGLPGPAVPPRHFGRTGSSSSPSPCAVRWYPTPQCPGLFARAQSIRAACPRPTCTGPSADTRVHSRT